jgi:hypothetical protein
MRDLLQLMALMILLGIIVLTSVMMMPGPW